MGLVLDARKRSIGERSENKHRQRGDPAGCGYIEGLGWLPCRQGMGSSSLIGGGFNANNLPGLVNRIQVSVSVGLLPGRQSISPVLTFFFAELFTEFFLPTLSVAVKPESVGPVDPAVRLILTEQARNISKSYFPADERPGSTPPPDGSLDENTRPPGFVVVTDPTRWPKKPERTDAPTVENSERTDPPTNDNSERTDPPTNENFSTKQPTVFPTQNQFTLVSEAEGEHIESKPTATPTELHEHRQMTSTSATVAGEEGVGGNWDLWIDRRGKRHLLTAVDTVDTSTGETRGIATGVHLIHLETFSAVTIKEPGVWMWSYALTYAAYDSLQSPLDDEKEKKLVLDRLMRTLNTTEEAILETLSETCDAVFFTTDPFALPGHTGILTSAPTQNPTSAPTQYPTSHFEPQSDFAFHARHWDAQRYFGLGLFLSTLSIATALVLLSLRRRKLADRAWLNLASEEGMDRLLSTGWVIEGSRMKVYDKTDVGYLEDEGDFMFIGGYEQKETVIGEEITVPGSTATPETNQSKTL